jgi:hypothetical protein
MQARMPPRGFEFAWIDSLDLQPVESILEQLVQIGFLFKIGT